MKKNKTGHGIKCDYCDKTATRNIQSSQVFYSIDKKGEYRLEYTEPDGGMNVHCCARCFIEKNYK